MSRVNELVHAVANLSHVERPYLENLLAIKKLRLAKDPVDLELEEAAAKVWVIRPCNRRSTDGFVM